MGSLKIWIAASVAYAAISAAIYVFVCWRRGYRHLPLRSALSFLCYLVFGLAVVYLLHKLAA